jgi:RecA/RadA recombinase
VKWDSKMGLHARLMSQALRKLTGTISKTNCTVFFINQLREKLGNVQILKQLLVETLKFMLRYV